MTTHGLHLLLMNAKNVSKNLICTNHKTQIKYQNTNFKECLDKWENK